MHDWNALPLFPLNTVLFPGMVLPLQVFEERYKLMVNRCLEEDSPFGVLLIRQGAEVGGPAIPYDVGTTAVIAGMTRTEEGRIHLVGIGSERFRLRAVRRDQPYLVGQAEPWPLSGASARQARALVAPVRSLFVHYLEALRRAEGHSITIENIPTEPRSLALTVAVAIQVPMAQKQHLLAQPTIADLLAQEQAYLRREERILSYIIRTQEHQWEGGHSGFLAKN